MCTADFRLYRRGSSQVLKYKHELPVQIPKARDPKCTFETLPMAQEGSPWPPLVLSLFTVASFFSIRHCFCLLTSKPQSAAIANTMHLAGVWLPALKPFCLRIASTANLIGLNLPP